MNKLASLLALNNEKLSLRLLFWILLLSSALAVIATTVQLYSDYRDSRGSLEQSLDKVEITALPAVAVAMWKLDKEVMESILRGLTTQSGLLNAEIVDTYNNPVIKVGIPGSENSFERIYPINFASTTGPEVLIGHLKVTATLDEIYQQLLDKTIIILLTQSLKTFLMSICILILIDRLVIRHLYQLAKWANEVDLSSPEQFLSLPYRKDGKDDVIDKVNTAINTMQSNLIKALAERESAQQFAHSIMDNSPSLIYAKDAHGRYTMVNQKYLSTFGLEKSQVIGHPASDLFSQERAAKFQQHDQLVIEKGGAITFDEEAVCSHKGNGENTFRYYVTAKFPIFDEQGELIGTGGVATDITEHKLKEQQIIELNRKLEQNVQQRTEQLEYSLTSLKQTQNQLLESEKMSALGNLVAGVAHEINTPLGVGVTAASHLQDSIKDFEQEYNEDRLQRSSVEKLIQTNKDTLNILLINLKRAVSLIRNFKQVAVDQSSESQRDFEIKAYLDELAHSLTPQLKVGGHSIHIQSAHTILVHSYPGALAQIFTNLIMNSVNHGFSDTRDGIINIDIRRVNKNVVIDYRDNGTGLTNDQREKVFEPFFTTARGTGGSGLGMSISYNLVANQLAGRIICMESEQGAHFRLIFPMSLPG